MGNSCEGVVFKIILPKGRGACFAGYHRAAGHSGEFVRRGMHQTTIIRSWTRCRWLPRRSNVKAQQVAVKKPRTRNSNSSEPGRKRRASGPGRCLAPCDVPRAIYIFKLCLAAGICRGTPIENRFPARRRQKGRRLSRARSLWGEQQQSRKRRDEILQDAAQAV